MTNLTLIKTIPSETLIFKFSFIFFKSHIHQFFFFYFSHLDLLLRTFSLLCFSTPSDIKNLRFLAKTMSLIEFISKLHRCRTHIIFAIFNVQLTELPLFFVINYLLLIFFKFNQKICNP